MKVCNGIIFAKEYAITMKEKITIPGKRAKILFVEDEVLISWSVATALRKDGLEVVHVETGEEAIKMLYSVSYDLILTDIKLPQINGIDVAAAAKSISQSTPVIVLSATDRKDVNMAIEGGLIDYFIEKPFDIDEVTAIISRTLGSRGKNRE
jgi:DNA-binding response OmpR family regulator